MKAGVGRDASEALDIAGPRSMKRNFSDRIEERAR